MSERKRRPGAFARVYDGLPSHPKVVEIPRSIRAEAMGTWILCLSWSNQQLRDGFVPRAMVEEQGGTIAGAEALVAVKLWRARAGGFQFVNYAEAQSTRADVEKARAANAERVRRHRSKSPENPGDGTGSVTHYEDGTNGQSSSSSQAATPTDEDHSQPQLASGSPQAGDGSVQKARRNPTGIDEPRIVGRLEELVGADVHVTVVEARLVAEHFTSRAKGAVQRPTAFVLGCITKHENAVANFLHTGRWSE